MTISWLVLVVALHGLIVPPMPEIARCDYWRPTYACALERARDQGQPLLLVLEDGSDAGQQLTALSARKAQPLLAQYQLCRMDVQTEAGQRLAEQYGASELPYMVITDVACKNVVFRGAGQFGAQAWTWTLAAHTGRPADKWRPLKDNNGSRTVAPEPSLARPLFAPHERLEDVTRQQRRTGKPLFAMVTTDGCFHCNRLRELTLADEDVRQTIRAKYEPVLVHVNEHPDWVQQYGVRIYPTLLIVAPDGELVDRIEGFVEADDLLDRVHHLERSMLSLLW